MTMTQTLPAGEIRRLPTKRARIQDDLVADYLSTVIQPGQRTIQIGGGDLGTVCLKRGAHHQIVAPMGAIEALQAACDRRAIPTDALSGGPAARSDADAAPFDLAIFGAETGFPAMAANWRHVSGRLRDGGVLVLLGADHGACARLADALAGDSSWVLEARIGGEAAIFRKTGAVCDARSLAGLARVADPARRPRGVRYGLVSRLIDRVFPKRPSAA
ncbi:hypothetical protein [uncultured Maricaulis sp.]|uniref:hypothetical protein n=1 Tax=uncultured Maricaulis sp. TaxID=174710 RepID=UPI0026308443|nr:hypothetical protein [uncultured Maricaulis sp.]